MPQLDKKEAAKTVAAVEKALLEGYAPPNMSREKVLGAVGRAAQQLKISRSTITSRIAANGPCEKLGLKVDWSKWKKPADSPPVDHIELRREKDLRNNADLRARAAERAAINAISLREGVFRLAAEVPQPPEWKTKPIRNIAHSQEALILPISDVHMGECVALDQMGGRNSYNKKIARARLERLFQGYIKMGTTHWTGPPPEVIYLVLLGDLITGEIHEELAKTNDLLSIPAVKEVTECLIAGINLLLENFKCPINIISVPGNHGRTTRKPEAKGYAIDSYDTLVAWNIESWYSARGDKRIKFSAPASGDALIRIHGWNILFTHGDRIGSRGGQGFVGVAATVARGMQKVIMDYAADGIIVDVIVIGHFHTALELEQGFANGPLIGPTEYSKSGRMRPAPASQWLLSVHPVYGIARRWKIYVGAPDEGSIYRGRVA